MARGILSATDPFRIVFYPEREFPLKRMIDPFAETTYINDKHKMSPELRSLLLRVGFLPRTSLLHLISRAYLIINKRSELRTPLKR